VVVMYYNRDLFDAQGVPYPQAGWTWQDFLDTAHQLTTIAGEGENQTGHWGFISSPWEGDVFLFALQHGGRLLDDPLRPTRPVFDPLVAEAVQWFADLALVHGVMPNSQTAPPDPLSAQGGFAMRQAAMVIGGVSQRDGADTPLSWDFGWGVVPLPRDAAPVSGMGARGYFIAAQSAQPQEAWALVRFLSASEPDLIPARREMAESESFRQRVGEELADAALTTLDEYDLFSFSAGAGMLDQHFTNWIISFARRSWEVVDGDITAEEMMDRLAEEYADW
jgi:multiple sugar transport system substrate-binding protein